MQECENEEEESYERFVFVSARSVRRYSGQDGLIETPAHTHTHTHTHMLFTCFSEKEENNRLHLICSFLKLTASSTV